MTKVALKIFVLYAERFGADIGSRACRALRLNLGCDFGVGQAVWNAELLKSPKLQVMAAREAMDSDVVFIATREGSPLPSEVLAWLGLWEKRGRSTPSALVALLKRDTLDTPHVVEKTLHKFARRAKMDFFCHSEVRKFAEDPVEKVAWAAG
jgi:hypothetical protein